MTDASRYSATETLRDGRSVQIRALKPEDRTAMANAVERVSAQSLYRRFFAARRSFSEKETDFFVNVDFLNHVALVAVVNEGEAAVIIGGGRYVLVQPGTAEVAFAVVDQYQWQGIGAALMRHLATIARDAGIEQFVAEVLPENAPMLKLFEKCGCRMSTKRDGHVVHVTLGLN